MGRKRNETKTNLETDKKTESTETTTNSQQSENVSGDSQNSAELEKEIQDITGQFTTEKPFEPTKPSDDPVLTPDNGDDDFIPRRERKKRETKQEKQAKERVFKLPGKLVNRATNRLMSGLVVWLDSYASKDPVPLEYVLMDDDEMNDEDNVAMAEEFIKALNLSGNPIAMYLGVMGANVLTNYMMFKSVMKQAQRKGTKVKFESEETDETKTDKK